MNTPLGPPDTTIEFLCSGCNRILKVPAAAGGKKASCPQCGTVITVPVGNNSVPSPPNTQAAPLPPLAPATPGIAFPTAPVSPTINNPFLNTSPPPVSAPQTVHASPPPLGSSSPFGAAQPGNALSPAAVPTQPPPQPVGRDTPTRRLFDRITQEISKIYVGQDELVVGTLVALFSNGHVLIESVPGLGKTLFVRTLGRVLGCQFGRIQFTADLMPSDITGAPIFDMKQQEFRFRPGPVFTQLLLADEINRSPAKTHAALLEIMQEFRVTVDGKSHVIERPFLVLATQNPIESEGTYNLPEAQLDRFMFKLIAGYPQAAEEAQILKLHSQQIDVTNRLEQELETITNPAEILQIIHDNAQIQVADKLVDYINKIVRLTRQWKQFHMGASPRAGLALMQAIRTLAAFAGRDYAVPDDVFQIALPALRHRVMLTAEAEVEGYQVDAVLTELIRSVEVPRL